MAGHSKWAQIKRQKAVTDATKSRVFSRFARLITLESKKAGGSLVDPGLAGVIARAKAANMPKNNIERAVLKGVSKDAEAFEAVTYECYGPGGTALIIDALTDNKNRTTQEIKHLLSKNNIPLAAPGAASWAFTKTSSGLFIPNEPLINLSGAEETSFMELLSALDEHEDVQAVFTNAHGYTSTSE